MQRVQLEVSPRQAGNKGVARRLRATGAVPAVVYGSGSDTINLQVDSHTLDRVVRHGINQLIDLTGDSTVKGKLVLVKEIQRDPVSQRLVHADFYQVDTKKTIHVSIPIHTTGKPRGVEMGGVLEPIMREVEVHCLPLEIPDSFELDVSALEIGDALHVSDIVIPPGVVLDVEESAVVIHVISPRVEEEKPEDEEGEAAEAGEGDAAPAAAAASESSDEGKAE